MDKSLLLYIVECNGKQSLYLVSKIVDLWGNSIETPIDAVFGFKSLNKTKLVLINLIVSQSLIHYKGIDI